MWSKSSLGRSQRRRLAPARELGVVVDVDVVAWDVRLEVEPEFSIAEEVEEGEEGRAEVQSGGSSGERLDFESEDAFGAWELAREVFERAERLEDEERLVIVGELALGEGSEKFRHSVWGDEGGAVERVDRSDNNVHFI